MEKFSVSGMTCAACSSRVERAVKGVDGVTECSVNLLTGQMRVEGTASREQIASAVISAGYGIGGAPTDNNIEKGTEELPKNQHAPVLIRLICSLVLLLPLMYLSMGHMLGLPLPKEITPLHNALIQLLICAVIAVINQRFFISGFRAVLKLSPNMDTLVALGSAVSFGAGVWVTFRMVGGALAGEDISPLLHELYFESSSMILTLITLGKLLEALAKGRTLRSLKGLMELTPKTAILLRDGNEVEVPVDRVRVGDVFVLRPGARVPVDGEVISGEGAVDESCLTGESIPVDKAPGASVFGATVNCSGYMTARAVKVGEDTVISEIVRMVSDASATKAPIAKLADKVSGFFVPSVLGAALVTLIGWLIAGEGAIYAIGRAVSVVVISCPCALGLATPVAVMVGSGVGASRGILYKSARALESSGRIGTVVLDKTGTVTKGSPEVHGVYPFGIDKRELLLTALALERGSEHPLGRAVFHYSESELGSYAEEAPRVEEFRAIGGKGVCGRIGKDTVLGVSFDYGRTVCTVDAEAEGLYARLTDLGCTPLCFIRGGELIGIFAVKDGLKEDAREGIAALHSLGARVIMLTGDNARTAAAIAAEAGIDEVVAGVSPKGKEERIRALLAEGERVMMVGDGINDAPALALATVGVAMGTGTDVAVESAEVVITGKRLREVADCISLGRRTLRIIKQNLFWAFIYNCVGIPLAAGLFGLALDPMFGAMAMSLSSFTVVMNALRINLFKPKYPHLSAPVDGAAGAEKREINITEESENKEMTRIIKVEGMMCPHCEARVKKALEALEGVELAVPSHQQGNVTVTLAGEVSDEVLKKAIVDQGYEVVD